MMQSIVFYFSFPLQKSDVVGRVDLHSTTYNVSRHQLYAEYIMLPRISLHHISHVFIDN